MTLQCICVTHQCNDVTHYDDDLIPYDAIPPLNRPFREVGEDAATSPPPPPPMQRKTTPPIPLPASPHAKLPERYLATILHEPARWRLIRELAKDESLPVRLLAARIGKSPNSTSQYLKVMV